MKNILFGNEARNALKKGIDLCADVVKVSLGGAGKNVAIFNGAKTDIINDGVSIIRALEVKDEKIQAGILLARQCADQTNRDAGDGTTTTIVLLQAFLNEIITDFNTQPPRELREELFRVSKKLLESIKPKTIETKEEMYNLALTASLDEEIATILSDGFFKLGKDAKVVIEESNKEKTTSEIIDGFQFDSKLAMDSILPSLSNEKATLDDIYVWAVNKVESQKQVNDKLDELKGAGGRLMIISNFFERSVLLSFMATKDFKFYAIENAELNSFDDIAEYGNKQIKAIITRENTTLIGGSVSEEYLSVIKKKNETEYDKDMTEKRIAQLTSGILSIEVGGKTDVEKNERLLKVEDASNALKESLASGYVPGAGKSLLTASESLSDEGVEGIVKRVAQSPSKQIQKNSNDATVPDTVIDSFKTVESSFLNALSTATSILTVEASLIELTDEV